MYTLKQRKLCTYFSTCNKTWKLPYLCVSFLDPPLFIHLWNKESSTHVFQHLTKFGNCHSCPYLDPFLLIHQIHYLRQSWLLLRSIFAVLVVCTNLARAGSCLDLSLLIYHIHYLGDLSSLGSEFRRFNLSSSSAITADSCFFLCFDIFVSAIEPILSNATVIKSSGLKRRCVVN